MTIWGSFVFAKPLGRSVQVLRELQTPENMPAMNNLIQTLDEYLSATDTRAHDVFRKAIGRPAGGNIPLDWPAPDSSARPLSDETILDIFASANGGQAAPDEMRALLCRFARFVEAQTRLSNNEN